MVSNFSVDGDSTEVVEGIKTGLEAALYEEKIEMPSEPRPGFMDENIKVQKEVYRVAEDWGLPIIRTWYRYGQFEPYDTLRPRRINPAPLNNPEAVVYGDISREDIKGYFLTRKIGQDWEMPLFEFLETNYDEWAPNIYKQAYLSNLDILETLQSIYSFSDRELSDSAGDLVDELQSPIIDLRYEIENLGVFDENVKSHVIGFLQNLKNALISLEAYNEEGLPTQTVRRAHDVYHGYIWPWAAMKISLDRANGPHNEIRDFEDKGSDFLSQFRNTFPGRRNDWEQEMRDVELVPTGSDYSEARGGVSETLGQFERGAVLSGLND